MYILFPSVLLILILFFLINQHRKKKIICRVSGMSCYEKCCLLNLLAEPFGFCYDTGQDIFTTRTDAWQKSFGYGSIYDRAALSMNMIFDTEPVYFNYQKKTWLIQFWKGQYGINTGAEAGVYHADTTVPPALRGQTLFHAAEETEMLPIRIQLSSNGHRLFCYAARHWWLTGFVMGWWCDPSDLTAEITITFPDLEMRDSFLRSLTALGYQSRDFYAEDTTVRILFSEPKSCAAPSGTGWRKRYTLWKTRVFCKLFTKITSPFCCTVDRLLYLYYYLPFAFRRTICLRTYKKHGRKHR